MNIFKSALLLAFLFSAYNLYSQQNLWEPVAGSQFDMNNLIIDSHDNFYVTIANAVLKSTNQGLSWATIYSDTTSGYIYSLSIKKNKSKDYLFLEIYRATLSLQYKPALYSSDYGQSWNSLNNPDDSNPTYKIWATSNMKIFVSGYHYYSTTDFGTTWITNNFNLDVVGGTFLDPYRDRFYIDNNDNYYLVHNYLLILDPLGQPQLFFNIYKSSDEGTTWHFITTGGYFNTGSFYPFENSLIYASVQRNYVYLNCTNPELYYNIGSTDYYSFPFIKKVLQNPDKDFFTILKNGFYYFRYGKIVNDNSGLPASQINLINSIDNDSLGNIYLAINGSSGGLYKCSKIYFRLSNYDSLSFSNVKKGDTLSLPLTIINPFSTSFTIDSISITNNSFFTNILPQTTVNPNSSIQTRFFFNTNNFGNYDGTAYLQTSIGQIAIRLNASVLHPSLIIGPDSSAINFGFVAVDSSSTASLILQNQSVNDIIIDSVGFNNGISYKTTYNQFPIILKNKSSVTLPITFTPKKTWVNNDSLVIYSNAVVDKKYIRVTGIGKITDIKEDNIQLLDYSLDQNYPNPFNPSTIIRYSIKEDCFVKLAIYNALGGKVADLVNEFVATGVHELSFNGINLSSGVYFYTITANSIKDINNFRSTRKMLLVK